MARRKRLRSKSREHIPAIPMDPVTQNDFCGACGCHRVVHDLCCNETGEGGFCNCGCTRFTSLSAICATCGHDAARHNSRQSKGYMRGTVCSACQQAWKYFERDTAAVCRAFKHKT